MIKPEDIVRHHDSNPEENPWVDGIAPPPELIQVVAYNPHWPVLYRELAGRIQASLGARALALEHVGSTSVPGLAAKPVIDIDLTVADPAHEQNYVPELAALGYVLRIREPGWHQHRCLLLDEPRVNLHVFGPNCPELIRHRLFRDWLRDHPEDLRLYADCKQSASGSVEAVMDYNKRKEPVIREIYARVFAAAGLL